MPAIRDTLIKRIQGGEVPSVNLRPILYKRLKIQGSTLRSRSLKYQRELISSAEFGAIVDQMTGGGGSGPIRTYVHKVCDFLSDPSATDCCNSIAQVYAWDEIQQAHREMAENKNRRVDFP
ncbi:hypothetical protein J3R82DRAFT_9766 [Butyriboletus roseoflavus]|nr:hypothetical protein J3R82DRAFT_9766 [Butyriboletus roseoflavus]